MIKFRPEIIELDSPFSNPEAFASNLTNKSLTSQVQQLFGDKSCEEHPDFENKMIVHFKNEGNIMTVESYCCEKFKEKLDLVAENKNPFKD